MPRRLTFAAMAAFAALMIVGLSSGIGMTRELTRAETTALYGTGNESDECCDLYTPCCPSYTSPCWTWNEDPTGCSGNFYDTTYAVNVNCCCMYNPGKVCQDDRLTSTCLDENYCTYNGVASKCETGGIYYSVSLTRSCANTLTGCPPPSSCN